jgi:type IV pilus assembly protein PilN
VSSFLRNMNASAWFKNPVLSTVVAADDQNKKGDKATPKAAIDKKNNRFALTVELEAPEPIKEDETGVKKTNKEASK